MKIYQIFLFALLISTVIGCQLDDKDSPEPQDTFVKYYGVDGTQVAVDFLFEEATQNVIILGSVDSSGGVAQRDVTIIRTDFAGNEISTVNLDFSGQDGVLTDDIPASLKEDPNREGGYLLAGTTTRVFDGDPYSVMFLATLNSDFSIQDSLTIDAFTISGLDTTANDLTGADLIRDSSDGTLIVTGSSTKPESDAGDEIAANGDETQIFIAKVDIEQDSVIWRRTRGFEGNDDAIYIDEFDPVGSPGNFVIVGTSEQVAGEGSNVFLLPINSIASPSDGEVVGFDINGSRTFDDVSHGVFKRPDGYVVTGTSTDGASTFPFFVNFNFSADEIVSINEAKAITLVNNPIQPNGSLRGSGLGITLGLNGNYVIVGNYLDFEDIGGTEKNDEILVTQLDQSGNEVPGMDRNYGLLSGNDIGEDVLILPNGDILILSTVDFGSGSTVIGLLRLNSEGEIMQ